MKVKITEQHVQKGQRCESNFCPIALALKERFDDPSVGSHGGSILQQGRRSFFMLDPKGRKFVADFDKGLPVEPCELNLEIITKECLHANLSNL
jgi:hypothetical protein